MFSIETIFGSFRSDDSIVLKPLECIDKIREDWISCY